jgi:hypothetical protein
MISIKKIRKLSVRFDARIQLHVCKNLPRVKVLDAVDPKDGKSA